MKLILFLILFSALNLSAKDIYIPQSLQEWKSWVLYGDYDLNCPVASDSSSSKRCIWYKEITFEPQTKRVTLKVYNFSDKKLPLALLFGNSGWIDEVKLDGGNGVIFEKESLPYIYIPKDEHKITYKINSNRDLDYLNLPKEAIGVYILKRGFFKKDKNQRVWLRAKKSLSKSRDSLDITIYRKISDTQPMRVDTYLHFRVSGAMRYTTLKGVLLDGFVATDIKSRLKSSMDENGSLRVELKAGEWDLLLRAYSNRAVKVIKKPKYNFTPANDEVWVFKPNPNFRSVKIKGATPIDPTQTTMPKSWKRFSAYLVKSRLIIKELYRSDKIKQNSFHLQRDIWLNFNGKEYTLFDSIDAKLNSITRLESIGEFKLLSLSIDKKPQILSIAKGDRVGVELNNKHSQITTSARYDKSISTIPVNGWNQKLDSAIINLNLPPAWRVLASNGSDRHSTLWIDRWDLLDIFLVLLLSVIVYKLFNLKIAILTILAGVIFWQEADAPKLIWIVIALLIALFRVLPEGKMRRFITFFLIISFIKVVLNIFSFTIFELRASLYPQLEKYHYHSSSWSISPSLSATRDDLVESKSSSYYRKRVSKDKLYQSPIYQRAINIDEKIQTGVAKPSWRWSVYSFYWNGSVGETDKLKLWLLPPPFTRIWRLLSVVGVLFLLYLFMRELIANLKKRDSKRQPKASSRVVASILLLLSLSPNLTYSQSLPSNELLEELRVRLLENSNLNICKNNQCASIEEFKVNIQNSRLIINMRVSALSSIYIPTFEKFGVWVAESVKLDNNSSALRGADSKRLYIYLPKGVHNIEFRGKIDRDRLFLESPLAVRVAKIATPKGWIIHLGDKHFLEVIKLGGKKEQLKPSLSPFILIKRVFKFDNRWSILTTITLKNSIQKPITFEYPLLKNESIITQNIKSKNQKAIIYLTPTKRSLTFKSLIPITDKITLNSFDSNRFLISQEWIIDSKPFWHIEYQGLNPTTNLVKQNRLLPLFKPWSGEKLTLKISKTTPVKGENLTIESSKLSINQSNSYRDLNLKLKLKSATALEYPVSIENLDEIKYIKIDGREYHLKPNNQNLTLPLRGGSQTVEIAWRQRYSATPIYQFPTINLDKNISNSTIKLSLPYDRWILYTSGATLGPVVLLWGVMVAIFLFAFILSKALGTPPTPFEWITLFFGIATVSPWALIPIVLWVGVLKFKYYKDEELKGSKRNLTQVAIVIFTLLSLISIVVAISIGLLANPDMQIAGNGSSSYTLIWYKDYTDSYLFKPFVLSISLWYYKIVMLVWSLWVAFGMVRWLERAWMVFSLPPIWEKKDKITQKRDKDSEDNDSK